MPKPVNKKAPKRKVREMSSPQDIEIVLEESLGKEKAQQAILIMKESRSMSMSGPLPASSEFSGYEAVLSGAADRILAMAEKEQGHRHGVEKQDLTASIKQQKLSLIVGTGLFLICVIGGISCALMGHPVFGGLLVGTAVLGVVTTILTAAPKFSGLENKLEKIEESGLSLDEEVVETTD